MIVSVVRGVYGQARVEPEPSHPEPAVLAVLALLAAGTLVRARAPQK
ncbi:hypothetical protein [Streptomyces varsoviensis]|nr:hypothetical protein [Streptomyces varsoviensis]